MFDFAVLTEEDFYFVNDLFTDLDEAVERSGMFKVRVTDSITKCSIGRLPRTIAPALLGGVRLVNACRVILTRWVTAALSSRPLSHPPPTLSCAVPACVVRPMP